jgi:4-amino-4-deoxy-L-arabinose transferase-like glycosyltransferase
MAKRHILILIGAALVCYLPALVAPREFWVADETRYAEVLREMIHDGHWIVPHLNGQFYADKPPLYFWFSSALPLLTGTITPLAFVAVSWLSAAGCLVLTYLLGLAAGTPRAAFAGALLLCGTLLFLLCAQIVRMDMTLTFFVLAALYCFQRGWTERRPGFYGGFYAMIALAVLTKGPLGFAFPFLPAVGVLAQRRDWRELRQLMLHWGLLLLLAAVGGWLLLAWLSGEDAFLRNLFVDQIFGRIARQPQHRTPFYFFAAVLPAVLLPWTGFVLRAVREAWRQPAPRDALLWWWFGAGFILISLVREKLFIYLLPLLPPLLIVLGRHVDALLGGPDIRRARRWEPLVGLIGLFVPLALLPLALRFIPEAPPLALSPFPWVFGPLTAAGVWLAWARRPRAALATLFAGAWLLSCLFFLWVTPRANALCAGRELAETVARLDGQGRRVVAAGVQRGIFSFYAGRVIPDVPLNEAADYLARPNVVVLMQKKHYPRFQWPEGTHVLGQWMVVDRYYVLVGPGAADSR